MDRHVETVCLLSRQKVDGHIDIDLDVEKLESTGGTKAVKEKNCEKKNRCFMVSQLWLKIISQQKISQLPQVATF